MATFTSSMQEDILKKLNEKCRELSTPKNKTIERALRIYIDLIERAEYIKSYKKAAEDRDLTIIAEEGMANYLHQIRD